MNPAPFSSVRSERIFLLALAGMQFTHILDFMIMMPLGPQLIHDLGIDTHHFGLLLSSYTFTAAASGLLATTYIDRFDRRKLLLTMYVLFIGATLACGLATGYAALLAARAAAGAFGGVLGGMVQTMIADTIPYERRGKAMGTVMAAFSLSTVAGVPLGLFLANHVQPLGWRAPFFFIVILSAIFWAIGLKLLPSLTAHLSKRSDKPILSQIFAVARNPYHMKAFAFMALMMMSGFTVIPYIALYATTNLSLEASFLTLMYLCGGVATFFSAPLIGRLADRHGKHNTFRLIALASFVPLLVTTHLVPVPTWVVLVDTTLFFVLVSGRIIPGMAMVSEVAASPIRGAFMSLVSSVQMFASGLASLVAGLIISRDAGGHVLHYDLVGYLAVACGLAMIALARHLTPHAAQAAADPARTEAA